MSKKHKGLFIFLSIITLGIFPIIIYWRSLSETTKEELSSSNKLNINLEILKKYLGGLKNVVGVEFTHTKVKVFIKERNLVNTTELKKLNGVSGVFVSSGAVTLVVGNTAKKIATLLSL